MQGEDEGSPLGHGGRLQDSAHAVSTACPTVPPAGAWNTAAAVLTARDFLGVATRPACAPLTRSGFSKVDKLEQSADTVEGHTATHG